MRIGKVYYQDKLAGHITATDHGEYLFQYTPEYVQSSPDLFLTFSMPVRREPYIERHLFPFFEGLIPEGWLLEMAIQKWNLKRNDSMGLLLACCQNCIGAVSIHPLIQEENEL
ncbi:serine/threonine-protein kinase HipA [Chitinophaga dinghuensis]|uniref:Serine/threonine-protein kinase HipA n=1 Tax=Chitinophaga dinghuensis TaxID=1539050 RepID=A0A327W564_9BACT|nr:HipA N-terminal domain-containing protein [Chitinophaga dinghuensis]RAJ83305.1 serine/threonine-protein kinase HipA [Chitinophaga dinghuensis]